MRHGKQNDCSKETTHNKKKNKKQNAMKTNPITNPPVAAEVTRRTFKPIQHPPPHGGGYALALLAAAALFTHTAFAGKPPPPPPPAPQPSSGTLVLDYAGPDGSGAANWGLVVAPSGGLYAVGSELPGGDYWNSKQLVLASGDSGSTWSLLDSFAPPGRYVDCFINGLGGGVTSDASGNLYVSSFTYDSVSSDRLGWYVRRSTDGGATWTTVDDMVTAPLWPATDDVGIAADGAGNVYVAATDVYYLNSVWYHDWTIRKGIGGTSFSTIDVLPNSFPKDIFVHPTAGIFVVGQTQLANKGPTILAWLVRRSTDGGATWSNVDTFLLSKSAVAMGIGTDASGNLYVVGSGTVASTGDHWIVRKSTNGGNSWTTVDDYQLAANAPTQARCFVTDAHGNLFVAGLSRGYPYHWIVRKSVGGTGPWTTVDDFQYGGSYSRPNAIAADAWGNVFVGGDGGDRWLIKRY